MNKIFRGFLAVMALILVFGCAKEEITQKGPDDSFVFYEDQGPTTSTSAAYSGFPETFETGSKTSYTAANVILSTGVWNLNDALLGTLSTDRKTGTKSLRIQNTGRATMQFNLTAGASSVSVAHAKFGTDANSSWELWVSVNSGSTWSKVGNTVITSSTGLATAIFGLSITGNVRFEIRKISGGRLNIDNFSVSSNSSVATKDDHLAMGNPSGATNSSSNTTNYLLVKPQYALAYNNTRGTARWVSWHLSSAWVGSTPRCDCFVADNTLPTSYFKAVTSNYTNTGFDRGHVAPSADRTFNNTDNAATFLMTNIMPQAPKLNQQTWAYLENYGRTLINNGNELYIISGGYGQGGSGSLGGTTTTIAGGAIAVPSRYWKVIVVLANGSNDVNRVSTGTRVIAVDMPNSQSIGTSWGSYRTSVDAIESATGLNIMSNVPAAIQNVIEASVDNGPTS